MCGRRINRRPLWHNIKRFYWHCRSDFSGTTPTDETGSRRAPYSPEYTYGDSRIDFYMERGSDKYLIEVKGCTLEVDGIGYFPDAPTERGVKHIRELIRAKKDGYHAVLAFVIQMDGISEVRANVKTHHEFGAVLDEAYKAGVEVKFLKCHVEPDSLEIIDG